MHEVRWKEEADRQLTEIWIQADDRAEVTAAVHSLERLLKAGPSSLGESRSASDRIVFAPPLVVSFHVSDQDRLVIVLAVRHTRQRDR